MSIVIPVRNDAGNLTRCLKAIQAQSSTVPLEIIVADNGSTDASREIAQARGATVLQLPGVRVSSLRNAGLRIAHAPLVAFIDADNQMGAGWFAAALPHFVDERVGAVGRDYSSLAGGTWVQRRYDAFRYHPVVVEPVRWLATGNLVVRRSAMLQVDGFDETLETCEDLDLCNRLRQRGYEILADPRMDSTHFGDPATLRDLFTSELWRGRDTLRVGLRGLNTWSELPSIVFPVTQLAALTVGLPGLVWAGLSGSHLIGWAVAALALVPALSCVRAIRMSMRVHNRRPGVFAAMWTIAFVYDVARALSLVVRMPHRGAVPAKERSKVAA